MRNDDDRGCLLSRSVDRNAGAVGRGLHGAVSHHRALRPPHPRRLGPDGVVDRRLDPHGGARVARLPPVLLARRASRRAGAARPALPVAAALRQPRVPLSLPPSRRRQADAAHRRPARRRLQPRQHLPERALGLALRALPRRLAPRPALCRRRRDLPRRLRHQPARRPGPAQPARPRRARLQDPARRPLPLRLRAQLLRRARRMVGLRPRRLVAGRARLRGLDRGQPGAARLGQPPVVPSHLRRLSDGTPSPRALPLLGGIIGRSMRRAAFVLAAFVLLAPGCKRTTTRPSTPAESPERSAMRATQKPGESTAPARPLKRCFDEDASGDPPRPLEALLDRAADRYDHGDFQTSLVCAEEAARVEPRSVEAHHDRAAALQEIGRLDEAESAFTRALALDPDDPETLAGAADLYINRLPPTNDHTETGLEFARRGSRRLKRLHPHGARPDRALVARLALLEGQALNDLGRSREALMRLDAALAAVPDDPHARYERAVALFDLCRFSEAKRAFTDVLAKNPHDAWAHHHLGLTLERLGDVAGADRELARARTEAPTEFPSPVEVSQAAFRSP